MIAPTELAMRAAIILTGILLGIVSQDMNAARAECPPNCPYAPPDEILRETNGGRERSAPLAAEPYADRTTDSDSSDQPDSASDDKPDGSDKGDTPREGE
jgi:hypothetical protein